jgi:anaerobic selenocysteine-containing dehydrogenase
VAFVQGSAKGLINSYNARLAHAFGTPNISTTGHVCFLPRYFASQMTYGSYAVPDYEHLPAGMVVWGANLAETRIGEHRRMSRLFNGDTRIIVVDPMPTVVSEKAHIWLRVRPGSDLALALGMIHVIVNEGLYDKEFVENFTVGFKRLKEHLQPYPPDQVAQITWVPSQKIVEAARCYARTKPAAIQAGNAIDHGVNNFQTARALAILRTITGNLDVPGGDVRPLFPLTGSALANIALKEKISSAQRQKRIDADQNLIPQFQRALPHNLINAILTEKPYPIQCVYVHAANPLLTHTHTQRTYNALMKLDFLAVADFFMTPTASLADIVLPAATYLEYDSVVAPPYYPFAQVRQKAIHIEGCWPDFEIVNALAKRLNLQDLFWENMEDCFDEILEHVDLTFDAFRKQAAISGAITYRQHQKPEFDTPSGKVELYSNQLKSWGIDPLPVYVEPPQTPLSDPQLTPAYPLVMTSRKSRYYLHSCGRQIRSLRRKHPEPVVYIHPQTAAGLYISDGDWVTIETQSAKIKQKAVLTEKVDPRVVCADYGWWFPEKGAAAGFGWAESNVNMLINERCAL